MKTLNILGVSAGQGALLFPFVNSKGFKVLANVEPRAVFHTPKDEQWKLNFKDVPFHRNFTELYKLDMSVDIIMSSPDCGASSIMRLSKVKQLGNPENNTSLALTLQAIQKYQPKLFLIENLPRLVTLLPEEYLQRTLPNYRLVYHQRSVSDYGNSQISRKRLVIIGIKEGCKSYYNLFNVVFKVNTPKLTRNILEVAQYKGNKDNYMIPKNKTLAMYDYRKLPNTNTLTVRQIHRLWNKDFKTEKKWPIKTAKMKTLPGVYRLENDKPPLTLRPADRQFRPDGWPLGIQDFKNIMGFPKEFKIYIEQGDRYLYYLNKARYTLAKGSVFEIGLWFKACLEGHIGTLNKVKNKPKEVKGIPKKGTLF